MESPIVRAPEPIFINVLRARNLRGHKTEVVTTMLKLEYLDRPLGESAKIECSPEKPAEFNFSVNVNVPFEDASTLDEIAFRPVICTLLEVLPKEKKQKDEKTVMLGQCTIDLIALLQGELKFDSTLEIIGTAGSPFEHLQPDIPRPELDVSVSVNSSLLTSVQRESANLMTVTVETLYSPPDSWTISGPNQASTFIAAMPVPLNAEKENKVVFVAGSLKSPPEKELPNRQKKWPVCGNIDPNVTYIPGKFISNDNVEDEDGDYKANEDHEHRIQSERDKNRVIWNIERRCFLDVNATKILQEKISKSRYWPVEIFKMPAIQGTKNKKDTDENHVAFHGIVYLNLAPLLYPGVKRIRGAYKVHPFYEAEMFEKTLRKIPIAEESSRIAQQLMSPSSGTYPRSGAKKEATDGGKIPAKDAKAKGSPDTKSSRTKSEFSPSSVQKSQPPVETDPDQPIAINTEGQQYADSKSYVMIEIILHTALVRRRPQEELAESIHEETFSRVSEYIPPRPLYPKRINGAQKSVKEFHQQIALISKQILDEYRETLKEEIENIDDTIDRRQSLIYHLNSSGKYFAFKEQLKHSVVKIVREKYLKTVKFDDPGEMRVFLSELYVYLVDQMHVSLNSILLVEDASPVPKPLTDSSQLKLFAKEAEINENLDLATKYYQERISKDEHSADNWFDYGTFNMSINNLTKAEECFKECVSIDQHHINGLLLYGVVSAVQDKHKCAETFFEAATCLEPKSILAWTMLGLFYMSIDNSIGTEMAILEANKLNIANARAIRDQEKAVTLKNATDKLKNENTKDREHEEISSIRESLLDERPVDTTPIVSASKQASAGAVMSAQHSPGGGDARIVVPPRSSLAPKLSSERRSSATRKSGRVKSTEPQLPSNNNSNNAALSRAGSMRSPTQTNLPPTSAPSGEEAITVPAVSNNVNISTNKDQSPVPTSSIYLQIIDFLLQSKALPFAERALACHLIDPLGGCSVHYHVALANLQLQKKELEAALENLSSALNFDFQSTDAWATMGHIYYLQNDTDSAKQCYERTLSFVADASDLHSIYLRLASIYLQENKYKESKMTFLMACKHSPTCVSWLGVGMACYRLNELSEAENALSEANMLSNTDPEVWGYLTLVCLRQNRIFEAEQSYKYAVKTNVLLVAPDLMAEITSLQQEVGFGNPQL